MLIVFALEPAPQANLIDRYLVAAENMGVEAALNNKADLLEPDSEPMRQLALHRLLSHSGDAS